MPTEVKYFHMNVDKNDKEVFESFKEFTENTRIFDIKSLMEEMEYEEFDQEFFEDLVGEFQKADCGWDSSSRKDRMLYRMLKAIDLNEKIANLLKYTYLYSDHYEDGSESYQYFKCSPSDEVINKAKEEIEKNVRILQECGVNVEVKF